MWEVKDNDGGIHDVDNTYTWSSSGTAADGTLFTDFLATLNTNPCFAGHCDWRVPNVKELQSIVDYGQIGPAIDPTFPGPTVAPGFTVTSFYWSSTSFANGPLYAWLVGFNFGLVDFSGKNNTVHGRAVRGGS